VIESKAHEFEVHLMASTASILHPLRRPALSSPLLLPHLAMYIVDEVQRTDLGDSCNNRLFVEATAVATSLFTVMTQCVAKSISIHECDPSDYNNC
jgi:hypothetical protein